MTEKLSGLPVAGYQPQTTEAVAIVNGNKHVEELILQHLDEMKLRPEIDQRWLAIGRTSIEQAFMAINRAVFQPARIPLPADFRASPP